MTNAKWMSQVLVGCLWMTAPCTHESYAEGEVMQRAIEQPVFVLEQVALNRGMLSNWAQEYRIEIFRDRSVVFIGRSNTHIRGEASGKLSNEQFGRIAAGFNDIGFFELGEYYGPSRKDHEPTLDGPTIETILFAGDKLRSRTVRVHNRSPMGTPPGFRLLISLIKRESGAKQWACPVIEHGIDICGFSE